MDPRVAAAAMLLVIGIENIIPIMVNYVLAMSSRELPCPLFDADNHLYEPPRR
jgi:hypothetical protein